MQFFTYFHFFYSSWFFSGEMPQWFPYVTYGLPANFFQFRNIGPIHYAWMFLGSIFKIKDVLLIFKLSMVTEQMIFLLGMYKLSSRIFQQRATLFFTCLTAIMCTVWYSGINYNFRIYYLFPLTAYFLILFFQKKRSEFLWTGGLLAILSGIGVIVYMICLRFFTFTIFTLALFILHRKSWKYILPSSWKARLSFLLFTITTTGMFFYLKYSLNFVTIVAPGRNPDGSNTLEKFLIHGSNNTPQSLLQGLLSMKPTHLGVGATYDVSFYIGLLPCLFFLWAMISAFHNKNKYFWPFFATTTALIFLSLGGTFTKWVYHFPMMAYYRHIGLVVGFAKIPLILCAGFGLDHFLSSAIPSKIFKTSHSLSILKIAILLITFSNLMIFQQHVAKELPKVPIAESADLNSTYARKPDYQPIRRLNRETLRQKQAYNLVMLSDPTAKYTSAFNFLQFDSCDPVFRVEVVTQGVLNLIKIPNIPRGLAGCFMPKLRLVPNSIFLNNPSDAAKAIYTLKNFIDVVILTEKKEKMRTGPKSGPAPIFSLNLRNRPLPSQNNIKVTEFSANEMQAIVNVPYDNGAWLVYADAFHPGWQATVNGKGAPILQAYLAFKAVYLTTGKNTVKFYFNPINYFLSHILALVGLLTGTILCLGFIKTILSPRQSFYTTDEKQDKDPPLA